MSQSQAPIFSGLKRPESITLCLETATPLYTGGIGQHGEAIQSAGLLGSIRDFSCLVAAALGDGTFEREVWGGSGDGGSEPAAKRVALRIDARGLKSITLPHRIRIAENQGWFFTEAQQGTIRITLTRLGISERHWQILLVALRIQVRHATFGARDQFGLGVLRTDALPVVTGLLSQDARPLHSAGLHHAFFAELRCALNSRRTDVDPKTALRVGLAWRHHLRGRFRQAPAGGNQAHYFDCVRMRHFMFGFVPKSGQPGEIEGSLVNISALYQVEPGVHALRFWGVLPCEDTPACARRDMALNVLNQGLSSPPPVAGCDGSWMLHRWEDGTTQADTRAWLNGLAGLGT